MKIERRERVVSSVSSDVRTGRKAAWTFLECGRLSVFFSKSLRADGKEDGFSGDEVERGRVFFDTSFCTNHRKLQRRTQLKLVNLSENKVYKVCVRGFLCSVQTRLLKKSTLPPYLHPWKRSGKVVESSSLEYWRVGEKRTECKVKVSVYLSWDIHVIQ